jgi:hypothetical protein
MPLAKTNYEVSFNEQVDNDHRLYEEITENGTHGTGEVVGKLGSLIIEKPTKLEEIVVSFLRRMTMCGYLTHGYDLPADEGVRKEFHGGKVKGTGKPIEGMLVTLDEALSEVQGNIRSSITMADLKRILNDADILYGTNEQFWKLKEKFIKDYDKRRRGGGSSGKDKPHNILAEWLGVSKNRVEEGTIHGSTGRATLQDERTIGVGIQARSIRHWSSVKKQCSFMSLLTSSEERDHEGKVISVSGFYTLHRVPSEAEAEIIRTLIGVKKAPLKTNKQSRKKNDILEMEQT